MLLFLILLRSIGKDQKIVVIVVRFRKGYYFSKHKNSHKTIKNNINQLNREVWVWLEIGNIEIGNIE